MTHEEAKATYGELVVDWHRCVAAEAANPEAFGLAETALARVCEAEDKLSEAEVADWAAAIAAQLVSDENDPYAGLGESDDCSFCDTEGTIFDGGCVRCGYNEVGSVV